MHRTLDITFSARNSEAPSSCTTDAGADIQAHAKAADHVWEARFAAGARQTADSVETEVVEINREAVRPVTYAAKSMRATKQPTRIEIS